MALPPRNLNLPPFLMEDAHGEILLTGHRVALYHVVDRYNEGYSPEMLLGQFPSLSLALIHKTLAFYLENKADVDRHVAACREEIFRQASAPQKGPDLVTLRQRLEASQNRDAQ